MSFLLVLKPSAFCAILTVLHHTSILTSVQCLQTAALVNQNTLLQKRDLFSTWDDNRGVCSYRQYESANETNKSEPCHLCSLAQCHDKDNPEIENVKTSSGASNVEDVNTTDLGGFEVLKVETEQALLEDESNGLKRHLFIAFLIQCQNATTMQTFISIDNNARSNGGAIFCHQITHSCAPSHQFETFVSFSEVLDPYEVYMLNLLFYSDTETVVENEGKNYAGTKRSLVEHRRVSLEAPLITAPVDGPILGSADRCHQLMMSSQSGYANWQIYAVVLTVFLFLAFLAALLVTAMRQNHFQSFFKSVASSKPQKSTIRLKKLEDNDCSVLIETDEDVDWEDEVFLTSRSHRS